MVETRRSRSLKRRISNLGKNTTDHRDNEEIARGGKRPNINKPNITINTTVKRDQFQHTSKNNHIESKYVSKDHSKDDTISNHTQLNKEGREDVLDGETPTETTFTSTTIASTDVLDVLDSASVGGPSSAFSFSTIKISRNAMDSISQGVVSVNHGRRRRKKSYEDDDCFEDEQNQTRTINKGGRQQVFFGGQEQYHGGGGGGETFLLKTHE
jgi:hypothetical protein